MASINIEQRVGKSGAISYRVRVRVTERKKIIDKMEMTFDNRRDAEKWAKKAQKELTQRHDDIKRGLYHRAEQLREATLGDLIREYLEDPITAESLRRTKRYVLKALLKYDIALIPVSKLTATDLIQHCKFRLMEDSKPKPQTVYHDVIYIRSVMLTAKNYFKINASLDYHKEAIETMKALNWFTDKMPRSRRLLSEEIPLIEAALKERENHHTTKIPYSDIFEFSLKSAMRIGEITNLKWKNLDIKNSVILVEDRKDPKRKDGNNQLVPLVGGALEIILKQRESKNFNTEFIFPYDSRSITAGWQRVLKKLGIQDLHYHDLRREAASRLAEMGVPPSLLALLTGHKDINILNNVYTQPDPKKFALEGYKRYAKNAE